MKSSLKYSLWITLRWENPGIKVIIKKNPGTKVIIKNPGTKVIIKNPGTKVIIKKTFSDSYCTGRGSPVLFRNSELCLYL